MHTSCIEISLLFFNVHLPKNTKLALNSARAILISGKRCLCRQGICRVVFGILFGTSENRNTFQIATLRYHFNVKYPWCTWWTSSEVFGKFVRRICIFCMPSLENFCLILTISEGEVSFPFTHVRHCLCYKYFVSKFEERTKTGSLYSVRSLEISGNLFFCKDIEENMT